VTSEQLLELGRVALAAVLAGFIGFERERQHRPAGLRTHMTVGMAAALMVVLADHMVARYAGSAGIQQDPTRILEAVVSGVAFVGAGTILMRRGENDVKGLTTAASLLGTASIGVACGVQAYVLAIGTTAMLLVVLAVVRQLEPDRGKP
jgi:putative Mg2+ transporter-C (MgtC) family protein